jgi:hypothetical protein
MAGCLVLQRSLLVLPLQVLDLPSLWQASTHSASKLHQTVHTVLVPGQMSCRYELLTVFSK